MEKIIIIVFTKISSAFEQSRTLLSTTNLEFENLEIE
jgi:hypothetical protein